jgi:tRNA pseudouridine55 synthase
MDGILLLNKEKGPTSFDIINRIKRMFKVEKIGHGGTLDPAGEGLLIALLGKATKISDYLPDDKEYVIDIQFGKATDTEDMEGEVIEELPVPAGLENKIKEAIPSFLGETEQIPPAFSAIKKDGKKLYELARAGEEVKPEPRKVAINSIEVLSCGPDTARLKVNCATGTYMRSLARDLGKKCGTCAVLTSLIRTRIGEFKLEDAVSTAGLTSLEGKVIPLMNALYSLPPVILNSGMLEKVKNGMQVNHSLKQISGMCKMVYGNDVIAIGQIFGGVVKVKRGLW